MRRSSPVPMLFVLLMSQLSSVMGEVKPASDTVESMFNSANGINIEGSILGIAAIVVGALMIVMGYRLFRATLFIVGFVIGGVGIGIIVEYIFSGYKWFLMASWIAFVIGGLISGSLVMSLYTVGIFAVGAAAGITLAMMIHNSVGYAIFPSEPQVVLVVLCVALLILGGVLAIKLEKPVLILATSLFGAAILVWGIGYFAGDFPSSNDLKSYASQDANGDWVYSIPSAWWGYLAGIVVLFGLGMYIQARKTGQGGIYHKSYAMGDNVQYVETVTPRETHSRLSDPACHV